MKLYENALQSIIQYDQKYACIYLRILMSFSYATIKLQEKWQLYREPKFE